MGRWHGRATRAARTTALAAALAAALVAAPSGVAAQTPRRPMVQIGPPPPPELPEQRPRPAPDVASGYIRGRVVEDSSGVPLRAVEVWAVSLAGGRETRSVRSDDSGRFVMRVPVGAYAVRARQLGAPEQQLAQRVEVRRRGHAAEVTVRLLPAATVLSAVAVTARPALRASALRRVSERRFLGLGTFVEHAEILRRGQPPLPDLLRGLAGVRVTGSGPTATVTMARARPGCFPIVYLDGTRLNGAHDAPDAQQAVLAMIPGRTVETVEVYGGPAQTPAEFGGSASPCGVLAVWSVQPTRPAPDSAAR